MTVAGLLLAAGAGRRFGGPKALADLDGRLLVDRAFDALVGAGCTPVVVVLGAAADEVVRVAELEHAVVIVNDDWREGMGSSLCCGLTAARDLGASAVAVTLVDQPGITVAAVERVVEASGGVRATRATYGGRPGHPVVLPAAAWPDVIASSTGDRGARDWFAAHADEVTVVACDDLGNDVDIDTAADLATLRGKRTEEDG